MIPIRDTYRSRNYPIVNMLIIAANVFLFVVETAQGEMLERFIFTFGLVPARYTVPEISAYFTPAQQFIALFSFMFLHGGFLHLAGNMWSLYIFGDNVEDRLGPIRYLLFYLCCGWVSGLAHLFINAQSQVPTIGASGAIAGVMGAYLVLYPRSKILTLIPIFIIPYFIEIPAFFFLGIWFFLQFLSAMGTSGDAAGIAWWAHIGGFVFGIVLLHVFSKVPEIGMTQQMRQTTARARSPRLHLIKSTETDNTANLYGQITISPLEARTGTRKLVSVPWGRQSKLINVSVPPGITQGTLLRLMRLGKLRDDGERGDLYLRVLVDADLS
ncbi:MAG: rhomboid family intramembrane serine protease [Desulfobacterales bacterium]|nr:rhomboid family intramembrane serine protease [Desulfobacterales bacterium]